MNKTLIEFKNHYDGNITFVFQHDYKKYVINGCQIFLEENKENVFYSYSVEEKYKNDVNEALTLLNDNVNVNDLLHIIKTYPDFMAFIKHEHQTYDMALTAVKKWGRNLKYICKDIQDYEMAMMSVEKWGGNLIYVRKDLQDYNMFVRAIENYGSSIKYVHEDLQDYNMAMLAIKGGRGRNLKYVREDLQTEELCNIAVDDDKRNINFIKCPVMKNKFEK